MSRTPAPADASRSLDRLKRAAKQLKKRLQAGSAEALARHAAVFGSRKPPAQASHADCLHILAREEGAESWPRLKLAVETAALTRAERIARLERAVANGSFLLVDRLLSLDPGLAEAHFGLQLALARSEAALEALQRDPGLATRPIGARWPIHHLCFSKIHLRDADAGAAMVGLLEALVAAGADMNQGYPAEPGSDHQLTALYGALGHAANVPLARALLEAGANPNDNESLYHATELETLDGVRLLFEFGAEIGNTNAFYRMLDRESVEGVALFLANGADPNGPVYVHPTGTPADERNALHHAILRGRSGAIGALLIDRGADLHAPFDARTPYALAAVWGNRSMAGMLEERGAATALSETEQFLAAVAQADERAARRLLDRAPGLLDGLTDRDRTRQTELATRADGMAMLRLLADLGFDPNLKGESDMPPIHAAAWWGHAEIVEMYLGLGVELEGLNMFGGTALGTAIHGSANCPGRDSGDYARCIESLVRAGALIRTDYGHLEMGSEDVTLLLEELVGDA